MATKTLKRMFKDKRGGIPVIEELWQGLLWVFGQFPAPIRFLFFLFILINLIGAVVIPMFQMFGYHCAEDETLYKLETWDILTNIRLMRDIAKLGDIIQLTVGSREGQYRSIPEPQLNYCGATYGEVNSTLVRCTNCSSKLTSYFPVYRTCTSDGYPKTDISFLEYTAWVQCVNRFCGPAVGEVYNLTTHSYQCIGGDCINKTIEQMVDDINEKIISSGGTVYTFEDDERGILQLKCNDALQPRPLFFGYVDIFDYRLWILLMVLFSILTLWGMQKK